MEDDDCPLLGRQPSKPTFQLVTNSNGALGIFASRSSRPIDVEFHGDVASVSFGGSIAGPYE